MVHHLSEIVKDYW